MKNFRHDVTRTLEGNHKRVILPQMDQNLYHSRGNNMLSAKFVTAAAFVATLISISAPASALDRRVTIVNETGYTIVQFYGSNTGTNDWQEDILGQDVLASGSSVVINFNDASGYCKFDFKAVFEDGDELVRENVNVCEVSSFTYQ